MSYNSELLKEVSWSVCCSDQNISEESGYNVCTNCGYVHSKIFECTPRRAFDQEQISQRKTNERVYNTIGPRTVIIGKKDSQGKMLNATNKVKYNRLSKINKSIISSNNRNFWTARPHFDRVVHSLSVSKSIAKDAWQFYKYAVEHELTRGRSIESLLSACLYTALRIYNKAITIEEIIELTDVKKKKFNKTYRLVIEKILPHVSNTKFRPKAIQPKQYIDKFYGQLKLSMECRNKAMELYDKTIKEGFVISGKDPKGIASALIYIAAKINNEKKFSQRELAELAKITEVTLRCRIKDFSKYTNVIILKHIKK